MKVHTKLIKAFGALLIAALLFAALPAGTAKAQTGQNLYVADWSDLSTISGFSGRPMVVHDGTTYHMWYGTADTTLYHTSSTDPASFPAGDLTTFDSMPLEVSSPAILFEGGTFYMITYKAGTNLVFSVYTSSNGIAWVFKGDVYAGEGLGTQGTDWRKIDAPVLLSDGGTYKLYFQVPPVTGDYKIFMAETGATTLADIADGNNDTDFTLANSKDPVLTVGAAGSPDEVHVQHPMVVKDGGTYFMWYTGVGTGTYYWRSINLATSSDGITWTKSPVNPIWFDTYSSAEPTVVKVGDAWHLWFEANESRIDYLSATGPFEFQTIQAAIDAASAGDTIEVGPGTYAENIVIGKSLNLIGPNAGVNPNTVSRNPEALIVHETGLTTEKDLVKVESDDVLIDGFMLDGKDLDQTLWSEGIYSKGNNLTVKNNIIKNFPMGIRSAGVINQSSYSGILIENNRITSEDRYGMFGIYVQGSTGTVTRNVVDKVESAIQVQPYNAPGSGLVENNYFSAYKLPLWFNYTEAADASWAFKSNTVTGEPYPVYDANNWYQALRVETFTDGTVSFTNNTVNIGDSNAPGIWMLRLNNITNGDIDLEATLDDNTWEKVVVVRDGTTGEIKTDYFYSSIQDAIDAASDGDTVLVYPGTYSEGIIIDKLLTIRSTDGAEETIIDTPPGTLTTGVLLARNLGAGTVIFDGFTVQNFSENGIVQPSGVEGAVATTFHVLNNIIYPENGYLRNGIQVVGDDSIVQGNTIYGAPLTDAWSSSAIMVIDGNNGTGGKNILVDNNTIIGGDLGVDIGIAISSYYSGVSGITVTNNHITDAGNGIRLEGNATTKSVSNVTIESNVIDTAIRAINSQYITLSGISVEFNQFLNIDGAVLRISPTSVLGNMDASPNWFGTIAGPGEGQIVGDVTYIPWCGDAECSFLVYPLEGEIGETKTITAPGFYFLKDGTVIDPGTGPCFDIQASNVTIESPGGALCKPGSPGIQVFDGAQNIVINGLEIDGTGTTTGSHGIHFLGSIEDLYLSDNFIHKMNGDGVRFDAVPTGRIEIKGNLFMDNVGAGINNISAFSTTHDIDATYNAWGSYGDPALEGDGVSNFVIFSPWTHVDVFAEYQADSSRYAEEVAVGEHITYAVKADLQKAIGAHFTLTFDTAKLAVVSASTDGTVFPFPFDESGYPEGTVVLTEGVTVLGNKITFDGASTSAISGEGQLLFTVTFEGLEDTDPLTALSFEAADDAQFAMNPGVGPSLNIFPVELVGEDVNVYDLPTLAIDPLDDFAVGNPKEFTLTVTNPATGRAYTTLNVELDVLLGPTLEYYDGTNWVTYVDGVEIGPLAIDATKDVLFRVTFSVNGGSVPVTVDLYDGEIFLVTDTFGFSVAPAFTVTASVSMQGRSVFNGVLVTLSEGAKFGPYTATSVNLIKNNVTFENVGEGGYTLTISQDRYLDLILANGKSVSATADVVLAHIELRGGDLNNSNDVGLSDASIVGRDYGLTGDNQGDGNFDSRVNIYDLAMVGGNYGLTSEAAYGTP